MTYENGMTYDEWHMMQEFIHRKSTELLRAQRKPFAITGLDISHWEVFPVNRQRFFKVSRNIFSAIVEDVLPEAAERYPEKFGTGRAEDVIEALYQVEPEGRLEDYAGLLQTEQFCYVLEIKDGVVNERVLRIDLFRMIRPDKRGGTEFVGGLFHALAHFSFNGVPLSTKPANHDVHPRFLIIMLAKAFFIDIDLGNQLARDHYEVAAPYDDKYEQLFAFYYEVNAGVYFVKTSFKRERADEAE